MPRKAFLLWSVIEKALDNKVQPSIRRRYEEQFTDLELTVIGQELPDYLAQFPASKNSASIVYTLGRMIQKGEWGVEPPEPLRATPAAPQPLQARLEPFGFTHDSLLEQMPPLIQCLTELRLEGTGICVDYALAGAIATVAAVCGNRLTFKAWSDLHQTNMYLVLVGETGRSLKSSVLTKTKAQLSQLDSGTLAADEGSVEALIKDLAESPHSRLWIRDEFAGLLAAIKGQDYLKPVRELLLSLYDHRGVYRRRLTRGEWTCVNPALSFLATIQPAVMGEELFNGRNLDSGFVNRLLLVCGEGVTPWLHIDHSEVEGQIQRRLRSLLSASETSVSVEHLKDAAYVWRGAERQAFGPYGDYVAVRSGIQALKLATIFEAADSWPVNGSRVSDKWLSVALELLERWYKRSVVVIADVHIRQPGERDRREFFLLACHATHNKTGPQSVGLLSAEAQISKRKAEEYVSDLVGRGWLGEDDEQRIVCNRKSPICEKVAK